MNISREITCQNVTLTKYKCSLACEKCLSYETMYFPFCLQYEQEVIFIKLTKEMCVILLVPPTLSSRIQFFESQTKTVSRENTFLYNGRKWLSNGYKCSKETMWYLVSIGVDLKDN